MQIPNSLKVNKKFLQKLGRGLALYIFKLKQGEAIMYNASSLNQEELNYLQLETREGFEEEKIPLNHIEENFTLRVQKQCKKQANTKPWLDSKGNYRPDSEIEVLGQSWSAKIWDDYLKDVVESKSSYEDNTVYMPFMDTETILSASELLRYLQKIDEYKNLKKGFEVAMKDLPKKQQEVIRLIFWKKLSQKQVAKKLGILESSVAMTKKRALNGLRKIVASKKVRDLLRCSISKDNH